MVINLIKDVLINELGIDPDLVINETKIQKDLQLDSTESVIIALEIKKKYGVDYIFPNHDVTLEEIAEAVNKILSMN